MRRSKPLIDSYPPIICKAHGVDQCEECLEEQGIEIEKFFAILDDATTRAIAMSKAADTQPSGGFLVTNSRLAKIERSFICAGLSHKRRKKKEE